MPHLPGKTMSKNTLKSKLRLGFIVFGVLVAIEIIEYIIGVYVKSGSWPFLGILAVIGAWPILYYFMHIGQLKKPEE